MSGAVAAEALLYARLDRSNSGCEDQRETKRVEAVLRPGLPS